MKNRHCHNCGLKKSCGQHHVYVIELDRAVLGNPKFCRDRSLITAESRCFYVGETKCKPDCRYRQHLVRRSRRKKTDAGFDCNCKTGLGIKKPFTSYNRGNSFVRVHHLKGALRPELYSHLNPIRGGKQPAKAAEQELARHLVALGHAVHFN